jgi:hypothetical protein
MSAYSTQALGDGTVEVEYILNAGRIELVSVWVGSERAECSDFSEYRLEQWRRAMQADHDADEAAALWDAEAEAA